MRGVFRTIGGLILAVMVFALGAGAAALSFNKLPFQTETIDRSRPTLLTSIQDIAQFHAAVGNFEVVLDQEKDVKWVPGFIAGERSLFVAAGTVNAFVDFSGLGEGDLTLSEDGTTATIRLPEAQLSRPSIDHDATYLYSQDRGVIDRINDAIEPQDQQELYQLAEQKIAAAAAESELMAQADTNTRAMLVGMFEALDIEVTFVGG